MIPEDLINSLGMNDASVHIELPIELRPPSMNVMYESSRRGGIKITDVGKRYINSLRAALSEQMMWVVVRPWLYKFFLVVCEDSVTNKSFVVELGRAIKKSRPIKEFNRTKNRKTGEYEVRPAFSDGLIKRKDADGPLKKVQDVFFDVAGIDDSHALVSSGIRIRSDHPSVHLLLVPFSREFVLDQVQVSEEELDLWINR